MAGGFPRDVDIRKIEHLGIAVTDLAAASRFFGDVLGLPLDHEERVEDQKVNIAFHAVAGVKLELLESTAPDGPIARHIEKRGTGVQHIAFQVPDIEAAIAELKAKGVRLLGDAWSWGAEGAKIVFVHPKDSAGVLVELVEMPR